MAVLGLCAYTHDSAAALFVNGKLIGFCEEERLNGEKHTSAYPTRAVQWLLDEAGMTAEQVDTVAYNFQPGRYLRALLGTPGHLCNRVTRSRALPRAISFVQVARRTRARLADLRGRFPQAVVIPVLHHRAHGLYAFGSSGFEDAAVLVVDSLGESQTTTISHAHRNETGGCDYRAQLALHDPASLGYLYGAVTEHLGWRRGDEEGTVMALAACGEPTRLRDVFTRAAPITTSAFTLDPALLPLRVLSRRYPRLGPAFIVATCPPRQPDEPVEQIHADLAAALQERTEVVMLHLAEQAHLLTGSSRLCVAGGASCSSPTATTSRPANTSPSITGTVVCPTSTRCSWNGAGPSRDATPPDAAPPDTPATCTAKRSCWSTTAPRAGRSRSCGTRTGGSIPAIRCVAAAT